MKTGKNTKVEWLKAPHQRVGGRAPAEVPRNDFLSAFICVHLRFQLHGSGLEPIPVGVARPLTPALSPDGGEGEETRRCSYRDRFQADDHPIAHFRFVRN